MARPCPVDYIPVPAETFGPDQPVREGQSGGGLYGELDIVWNLHYCHANITPPWVSHAFNSDSSNGAGAGAQDYACPALTGAYVEKASWRRKVYRDLPNWNITVYYYHSGAVDPANDGFVKFQLASDPTKLIEIRLTAGDPMWTRATGTLVGVPTVGGGIDTIEMHMKNGAAGTAYIKSVSIRPAPLSSIPAGVSTEGFVPLDTTDASANDPLSVWARQVQFDDCEILRKTRAGTISAWSENHDIRTPATYAAYKTTSTSYVTQAILPFRSGAGQTTIQWAILGYYSAGASGTVRLRTGHMIANGIAAVTYGFGSTWTTPYQVWHDDGGSTLTTLADYNDHIEVSIIAGAGSTCYLMGWGFWHKDVT